MLSSTVLSTVLISKKLAVKYANDDFSESNILLRSNNSKNGDDNSWKGGGYA